jgi:hypothetical protein
MTHHEEHHEGEEEFIERVGDATEETRLRRGQEGADVTEPPDPLAVPDDEGDEEIRAF